MYENDTPNHITLPDPLDVAMTDPVLQKLLMIIQQHQGGGPGQEPETNDQWQAQVGDTRTNYRMGIPKLENSFRWLQLQFAKIILARIYFETARYDQALEALERLALPMQQVHSGYGMVLLIQARVIKGNREGKGD